MATRPKRMSRKELRQQDEVMTQLQQLYEWLRRYRVHLVVGAVALIVVLLAASAIVSWLESSRRDVAQAFDHAYAAVIAPVAADGDAPAMADDAGPKPETFPTEEAKHKEAVSRLEAFLAEHAGSPLGENAALGIASVRFDEGQLDDAATRYAKYLDDGNELIDPVVIENLGIVAAQQKKADEAAKWFGKLVETSNPYFKALGHLHLGDLANPNVSGEAAKDAGKAKSAYEAGIAALTTGERKVPAAERWLQSSLERRLALLDAR